jgi:hypothetical protein
MSPEDLQKFLNTLTTTLQQFVADVNGMAKGLDKDNPSILTVKQGTEANKAAQEEGPSLTDNQRKKQQEIAIIFSTEFAKLLRETKPQAEQTNTLPEQLFKSITDLTTSGVKAAANTAKNITAEALQFTKSAVATLMPVDKASSDEQEVASESSKVMDVNILSIDEKLLKSLKSAKEFEYKVKEEGSSGGIMGFFASLIGGGALIMGGALTALAGGIGAMTAALSALGVAAIPVAKGIGIIALALPVLALSFSTSAGIIIGALWLLKEPLLELMPAFQMFGKLFKDYILNPILDALANILPALAVPMRVFKDMIVELAEIISPSFKSLLSIIETVLKGIFDLANNIVTGIAAIIPPIANAIGTIAESISNIVGEIFDSIVALGDIFSNMFLKSLDVVKDGLVIFGNVLKSIPDILNRVFDSIINFSKEVDPIKITSISAGLGDLVKSLVALTAGSLLSSITSFFTDSPFDKIIEFQNELNAEKSNAILILAAGMERLSNIKSGALTDFNVQIYNMKYNVDKLSEAFDNLVQKIPGESAWSSISSFADKASKAFSNVFKTKAQAEIKQNIEVISYTDKSQNNTSLGLSRLGEIMTKISDTSIALSKVHIDETRSTNKILSNILQKMQDFKMTAAVPAKQQGAIDYNSFPLQYTATQMRQQMLAAGYA